MSFTHDENYIVIESDIFTRFLRVKEVDIRQNPPKPHPSVFSSKHPKGFSVFRTTGQNKPTILEIAVRYVKVDLQKFGGWFNLTAKDYKEADLSIERNETSPKHYNVWGMPVSNQSDRGKELSARFTLAKKANTVLYEYQKH